MDNETQQRMIDIGRSLAWGCVDRRDFTCLNKYIDDTRSDDSLRRQSAMLVIIGAGIECTVINNAAIRAGISFSEPATTIDDLNYVLSFNFVDAVNMAGRSLFLTAHLVIQSPTTQIARSAPKVAQGGEQAPSEPVSPAAPVAMPLEVKIVSMPDRVTESSIERDKDGQIVKSVQYETDVS